MNLRQTRYDPVAAVVTTLAACNDEFAARKTPTRVVICSPVEAGQPESAVDMHTDQAFRRNPQPAPGDALQAGAAAGRISVAALAAAHKVARYHADASLHHAAPERAAETDL